MRLLPLLLTVLLVSPPVSAAESPADACARLAAHEYEDGRPAGVAIESIDVAAALPACRAAHTADPESMPAVYRLGRVLQAARKFTESSKLYGEAASGGYAMGQVAYSRALLDGRGIPQDLAASFHWIKEAADQGHPVGLMDASSKYQYGIGVDPDLDQAVELLEAAAALDEAEAERRLGDIYFLQQFGRVDYETAVPHYQRAIALGSALAEFSYGQLLWCDCEYGDAPAAVAHFESALSKGIGIAGQYLALAYMRGEGIERDDAKALELFLQTANAGDLQSAYYVGLFYYEGRGVERDTALAEEWWRAAAKAGLPDAQIALGQRYLFNPGDAERLEMGVILLERAGAAGLGEAYRYLFMHFSSIPVNDLDRAKRYALLMSQLPDPQSAEEGRALMKSVDRMVAERKVQPIPLSVIAPRQ